MSSPQQSRDSSRCEAGPRTTGSVCPCTVCRGCVLIFTRFTLRLVTTSHFWSFPSLAFPLHPFHCSSALPCPAAPPAAPAQLCSCPSVSSWAHPAQSLVSSCSTQPRQELLGPSRAPSPAAWKQTVPKAPLVSPGAGEGWLLICRRWLLRAPVPAPAHPSTSLCITSSGRLQPAKADSLAENILDHGHLLPTGPFFLHNPNFLTDEGSLASL